jgi:hypothetical protein
MTKKGERAPKMSKLLVSIPEDLHKQLKIFAIEQDLTVREIVTKAIQRVLKEGGKRQKD